MTIEDLYGLTEIEISMMLWDPKVLGDLTLLREIFRFSPDVNVQHYRTDFTSLHYAASYGLATSCAVLFSHGADLEIKATDGQTPLHKAVLCGHIETCKMLLECGADVNAQDKAERTPLHIATCESTAGARLFTIHSMVKLLLEFGASVDIQTAYGYTPLHFAAIYGDIDIIRIILDQKPNLDTRDLFGCSVHDHIRRRHDKKLLDAFNNAIESDML